MTHIAGMLVGRRRDEAACNRPLSNAYFDVTRSCLTYELAEGEMKSFFARMSELPGIKKVLEGNSKLGPLADYLVPMP